MHVLMLSPRGEGGEGRPGICGGFEILASEMFKCLTVWHKMTRCETCTPSSITRNGTLWVIMINSLQTFVWAQTILNANQYNTIFNLMYLRYLTTCLLFPNN